MYKIINFSKRISKNTMEKVIEKLNVFDNKFSSLTYTVRFYDGMNGFIDDYNNNKTVICSENDFYIISTDSTLTGAFVPETKNIFIIVPDFKNMDKNTLKKEILNFIDSLIHEIRHCYQEKYMSKIYYEETYNDTNYTEKKEDYIIENDAYEFANKFVENFKEFIMNLFKLNN